MTTLQTGSKTMKQQAARCSMVLLAAGSVMLAAPVAAQEASASRLHEGSYVAPMASYLWSDDDLTDDGFGGAFALGYRPGRYAVELSGTYNQLSGDTSDATLIGASINGLLFPFGANSNFYVLIGAGALEVDDYPGGEDADRFSITTAQAGPGYMLPLSIGSYDFALRGEVLYRYGHRDSSPASNVVAPDDFKHALVNLGLQLPLGRSETPVPEPEPIPVAVVPVETPPDSDGDGVADDRDQCPGTPAGTQVNEVGCPLPPPCRPPEPGERISLEGCGAGDLFVLHGVTFEFDKSRLTPNARTILDGVADELTTQSALHFELSGHTDSKGSDTYNQKLSESRAESVRAYLIERGIAEDRMVARGYGESLPVADNDTDEGRELNRRVELKITASVAPTVPETAAVEAASIPVAPAPAPAPDALAPADSSVPTPIPEWSAP